MTGSQKLLGFLPCNSTTPADVRSITLSIASLRLSGMLSFAPDSPPFELRKLNVLIGPNGSGKSNLIEAIEVLAATPRDLAATIRDGGGPSEWIWKGSAGESAGAEIDAILGSAPTGRPLRYRLQFKAIQSRVEVTDEAIEEARPRPGLPPDADVHFFYRFQRGAPVINIRDGGSAAGPAIKPRHLERARLLPDQSVLAQRKDPDVYPEVAWVGDQLGAFHTFREWAFGRYVALRLPQPADLPEDRLLPDCRNLALVLNQIDHADGSARLNSLLRRFFPRFERLTTRVLGGSVQFYVHESGFDAPIPATRLSDGTIRFIAILAALLATKPPPLLCIEEPELGLHPDALAILGELLVEASERMQLIVTTHSDALVSALTNHADAVVACERPGAATQLRRLDPERLADWLQEYQLGDLWRIGELGANP